MRPGCLLATIACAGVAAATSAFAAGICRGMSVDVAIVGGGLSGLAVAHGLHTMGMDKSDRKWALLEAHATRIGGRIKNADGVDIDLGPAWLWPQHQPKMSALARDLGVATFPQPDDSSSTRLVGGAFALVQALHSQLPAERVKMGFLVKKCKLVGEKIELTSQTGDVVTSGFAVFAAPPKIVAAHIEFEPALSAPKRRAMAASQTWMAGVTKVALQYPDRFWPLQGGVSNTGLRPGPNQPAFQVYDGSSAGDKTIALVMTQVRPRPAARFIYVLYSPCIRCIDEWPVVERRATFIADSWLHRPFLRWRTRASPTRLSLGLARHNSGSCGPA